MSVKLTLLGTLPTAAQLYFSPGPRGGNGIVPLWGVVVNHEIPTRYQPLRCFRYYRGPNTGDVLSDTSGMVFNTMDYPRR